MGLWVRIDSEGPEEPSQTEIGDPMRLFVGSTEREAWDLPWRWSGVAPDREDHVAAAVPFPASAALSFASISG